MRLIETLKDEVCLHDRHIRELKKHANEGIPILMFGNKQYAGRIESYLLENNINIDGRFTDLKRPYESESVMSFEDAIKKFGRKIIVVIGFLSKYPLEEKIRSLDKDHSRILKYYHFGYPYPYPASGGAFINHAFIQSHEKELERVYDYLEDEQSRKVFLAFLKAKITDDTSFINEVYSDNKYFQKALFVFSDNEVIVDGGAYTGDTLLEYLKEVGSNFSSYFAFEPDEENRAALHEAIAELNLHDVHVVDKGLLDKKLELPFSLGGDSSRIEDSGESVIETVTIDLIAPQASFIKLDIEGNEYNALLGAQDTIVRNKPKLAVCVYHTCTDLFKIPLFIKSLCPEYKLYLRTHEKDIARECVLYATM